MSDKKQSSIEYYKVNLANILGYNICSKITIEQYNEIVKLEKQVTAMHKKEIIEAYLNASPIEDGITIAFNNGNDYYSETYEDNNE